MEISAKRIGGLSESLVLDILHTAVACVHPKRVILFGSRARGEHGERSDIDLAIEDGEMTDQLRVQLEERIRTLLKFDVVDVSHASEALKEEIRREGITLYEEA